MKSLSTKSFPGLALLLATPLLFATSGPFTPSNPPEMKPLTNPHSAAYQTAKLFLRGVNLGDYLEAGWGSKLTVSTNEFTQIRKEGFDHIRVPIGWHRYAGPGPDFPLRSEIFAKVDYVVTNALANQLAVIINIHHFNEFDRDPAGATDQFIALWRQIAAHYESFPKNLAFELDNEPHDAATTAAVNPIYPRVIAEIRKTNPHRTLFVEPGNWGNIEELRNLVLPDDDNLIVSVHCYEPFFFTHQGTSWGGPDVKVTGYHFPGPPETPLKPAASFVLSRKMQTTLEAYNSLPAEKNPSSQIAFEPKLEFARAWSEYYGRPVHLGEFGCYVNVDATSRARYYKAVRCALEKRNIGWAIWDWTANFRYWDKPNNQPMPGMRDALFGKETSISTR